MQPTTDDIYQIGGINVDVNPFQQKDSDCNLLINFYTRKALAKKVRFGYTTFLDNPDSSPIRNLEFYQFSNSSGLLRVSNKNTYLTTTTTGSWGSPVSGLTWGSDVRLGTDTLMGAHEYIHLSESVNGWKTWDGTTARSFTSGNTPKSSTIAQFNSRMFGDINKLSVAESYVSFDLNSAATTDPFTFDVTSGNPNQGGTSSGNAGNYGKILQFSMVNNTLQIYKQRAIIRFDGSNFIPLNFLNSIVPNSICTSDYSRINYFLSFNGIWANDASQVQPISFGVNTIIQDTFSQLGIPTVVSFCFDYLNFFFVGSIYVAGYGTIPNAMFVRDERFGEWYIWSIGHTITAFGSYTDNNNVRHMVTGDNLGNTYVWGEEYSSDNGTAINYLLRTKYLNNGTAEMTKVPQPQLNISSDATGSSTISLAKDYSNNYIRVGVSKDFFSAFNASGAFSGYKNSSLQIEGSTTTDRPEFYGWTLKVDEEERYGQQGNQKR